MAFNRLYLSYFFINGNPFAAFGNPFAAFGNPFAVFGNPFVFALACFGWQEKELLGIKMVVTLW
jgi:hypothetical protein